MLAARKNCWLLLQKAVGGRKSLVQNRSIEIEWAERLNHSQRGQPGVGRFLGPSRVEVDACWWGIRPVLLTGHAESPAITYGTEGLAPSTASNLLRLSA
jgi:hypothetical protein